MKNFIAFSGSLRKDSFNTSVLKALTKIDPNINIEIADISTLPLYNQDLEMDNYPTEAKNIKEKVLASNGVIFVTPEYNRSIPGVLKNAIDWLSRPYGTSPFGGKSALIMGASNGAIGTALAQSHLKQVLLFLNMRIMGQPEIYISGINSKIDNQGELTDEDTKEHLRKALSTFVEFCK